MSAAGRAGHGAKTQKKGRCWLRSAALAYLLAGKVLAFLPAPAWDVRALSFVHHCIVAPVVEELVFRGAIQQLAQPLGQMAGRGAAGGTVCSAARHPGGHGVGAWHAALCWAHFGERTGRVWLGDGTHTLNNLLVLQQDEGEPMTDFELMGLALEEARKAAALGEVPVGAVVARRGEVVAAAHNTRGRPKKNALHHAELLAIDAACKKLGGWRLWECELFVYAGALPHVQRRHHQQPHQAGGIRRGGCQGRVLWQCD